MIAIYLSVIVTVVIVGMWNNIKCYSTYLLESQKLFNRYDISTPFKSISYAP